MVEEHTTINVMSAVCVVGGCERKRLDEIGDNEKCILHAPKEIKDAESFQHEIEKIVEKATQGEGICDFSETFFPKGFEVGKDLIDAIKFHCIFSLATFSGRAFFQRAEFSQGVTFYKTTFSLPANFIEAKFNNQAIFIGSKFAQGVHFNSSLFSRHADFSSVEFCVEANFDKAKFLERAFFFQSHFKRSAYFAGAEFNGFAEFSESEFDWDAYFGYIPKANSEKGNGSEFHSELNFVDAKIKKSIWFTGTHFNHVEFTGASFNDATFQEIKAISSSAKQAMMNFRHVPLNDGQRVNILDSDLKDWNFEGTDLRFINFNGNHWPEVEQRKSVLREKWFIEEQNTALLTHGFSPHSELSIMGRIKQSKVMKTISKTDWYQNSRSQIEEMYRQLKLNFENKKNHVMAGQFFVSEMELRKLKYPPWHFGRLPYWYYKTFSNYGENVKLSLLMFLQMYYVFTIAMLLMGYQIELGEITQWICLYCSNEPYISSPSNIWWAMLHTLQSMTLFGRPELIIENPLVATVSYIIGVAGVTQLGFFATALRRRFRR